MAKPPARWLAAVLCAVAVGSAAGCHKPLNYETNSYYMARTASGDAITGELKYLIPDPGDLSKMTDTGTSASGIGVDADGNIYAADVGFNNLRKYVHQR